MRVVLDTNILVSALIAPGGKPAAIYSAWVEGKFTLLIHNPRPFGGETSELLVSSFFWA
jgi:hypothetical protein